MSLSSGTLNLKFMQRAAARNAAAAGPPTSTSTTSNTTNSATISIPSKPSASSSSNPSNPIQSVIPSNPSAATSDVATVDGKEEPGVWYLNRTSKGKQRASSPNANESNKRLGNQKIDVENDKRMERSGRGWTFECSYMPFLGGNTAGNNVGRMTFGGFGENEEEEEVKMKDDDGDDGDDGENRQGRDGNNRRGGRGERNINRDEEVVQTRLTNTQARAFQRPKGFRSPPPPPRSVSPPPPLPPSSLSLPTQTITQNGSTSVNVKINPPPRDLPPHVSSQNKRDKQGTSHTHNVQKTRDMATDRKMSKAEKLRQLVKSSKSTTGEPSRGPNPAIGDAKENEKDGRAGKKRKNRKESSTTTSKTPKTTTHAQATSTKDPLPPKSSPQVTGVAGVAGPDLDTREAELKAQKKEKRARKRARTKEKRASLDTPDGPDDSD